MDVILLIYQNISRLDITNAQAPRFVDERVGIKNPMSTIPLLPKK